MEIKMTKDVLCEGCHAIGVFAEKKNIEEEKCPVCGGKLLLVHHEDFHKLLNQSDCPLMPNHWNKDFEECRKKTTCIRFFNRFPNVRILTKTHNKKSLSEDFTSLNEIKQSFDPSAKVKKLVEQTTLGFE